MDEKIEQVIKGFTEDVAARLREQLVSVILYGSAAGGEYVPGRSDLNFLLVLGNLDPEKLAELAKPLSGWRKQGVGLPLFLATADIANSLDSFPLEFLEMKRAYRVLMGEDVLAGITIGRDNLRLQCEREIKGKLIQLRRGYLELSERTRDRDHLFRESVKAFVVIMRSMLWLADGPAGPMKGAEVIAAVEKKLSRELPHLRKILEFRTGKPKLAPTEAHRLFAGYLDEVQKLSEWIDKFEG